MWSDLGFEHSPYDSRPLGLSALDAALMIGRRREVLEFVTLLEASDGGCIVVAGRPGVGKTSFVNVTQYQLTKAERVFGPKVSPSHRPYSVQRNDDAKSISIGCLDSILFSIEKEFSTLKKSLPEGITKIRDWRQGGSKIAGGTISIFGVGGGITRTVNSPNINECSLDIICDMIQTIVVEAKAHLNIERVCVCLDNFDNLDVDDVPSAFVALRDNLFCVSGLWVIAVGHSGLFSLIQSKASKASERIQGNLELDPLSIEEVHEAIDQRVEKFSQRESTAAPISRETTNLVYEATEGELRFTLRLCDQICERFVMDMREQCLERIEQDPRISIADIIKENLVDNGIPDPTALSYLETFIEEALRNVELNKIQSLVLSKLCSSGGAMKSDWKKCGASSSRLFNRYCLIFEELGLVRVTKRGRKDFIYPTGILSIAQKLDMDV